MRFGSTCWILRGGHKLPLTGQFRLVRARYIGARKSRVYCELLDDDQHALAMCTQAGSRGWWGRRVMYVNEAEAKIALRRRTNS